MAAMTSAGLFNKKDRILCCRDPEDAMGTWLKRQRFKVETVSVEDLTSLRNVGSPRLFDVVLMTLEQHELPPEPKLEQQLHEGYGILKPGGRFLLCCRGMELFAAASAKTARQHLSDFFAEESVASITQLQPVTPVPADIILIKKGGAYKPRLPVHYVDAPSDFQKVCDMLSKETVLGLDVETTLKEPRILCTVQLSTEKEVYLIDALPMKDLTPLKMLMENKDVLKIIHNKTFEEKVLGHYGIQINNIYDTLIESRKRHKKNKDGMGNKLGEVCERELGIYLDKSLQASDWTSRPLTQGQRDYAAADAEVLLQIYRLFVPPPVPENLELF